MCMGGGLPTWDEDPWRNEGMHTSLSLAKRCEKGPASGFDRLSRTVLQKPATPLVLREQLRLREVCTVMHNCGSRLLRTREEDGSTVQTIPEDGYGFSSAGLSEWISLRDSHPDWTSGSNTAYFHPLVAENNLISV